MGNQAAVDTWGDYCYDLSGTAVANELNTDAYNLYDADGKLCSIGYCYECYGIIVNEDLLEKAGYTLGDITKTSGKRCRCCRPWRRSQQCSGSCRGADRG